MSRNRNDTDVDRRTTQGVAQPFRPRLVEDPDRTVLRRADLARHRWWRDRRRRRMLSVADLAVSVGIGAAVAIVGNETLWLLPLAAAMGLLAAKLLGLYDVDHRAIRHLTVDEMPTLSAWAAITTASAALVTAADLTVGEFVVLLVAATIAVSALRALARLTWRLVTPRERTLVVGEGAPAIAISRKIELFDDMHLELASVEDPAIFGRESDDPGELSRALAGVDRVVLAWSNAAPDSIADLLNHCRILEIKLSVVSPFRGHARPAESLSHVADLPVLEYNTWDIPRSTMAIKRVFDVMGSIAGLILFAPIFIASAIAIKLDDRGPVLYVQQRAGRNGKAFRMIKFRSMADDAEEQLADLVSIENLDSPVFKLRADPRVTRVGRHLRRFSLDELPQLVNVLRGEMSLVGPRPEELALVERYETEDLFRLELRPGLTGPMQVLGRGDLTFAERFAVDMDYLETLSVYRDLRLIALTIPAVIRGKGAY